MLGLMDNEPEQYTAEQQKEMLDNIKRSALSIFNLLNDLLAWSKAQAGQLVPNPETIDLCVSIHEVLTLFESLAASKQIELRLIAPDVCSAYADQYFVQTVLRNLLANALKFTPKNGTVKVEMLRMPGNIVLRVSDNGIGIDTDKIKLLWDQSSNYSTRGSDGEAGTGMGLQLCREMVSSWGGEIGVDSVEGQGSTFYFTIPNETAHSRNE
jgi:signal transduction histidine kinase